MKKLMMMGAMLALVLAAALPAIAAPGMGTGEKVTLCHQAGEDKTVTLEVGSAAATEHLGHGDLPGECGDLGEQEVCPDGSFPVNGVCAASDNDNDGLSDDVDPDDDDDSQPDWCDPSPLVNDGNQSFDCMF